MVSPVVVISLLSVGMCLNYLRLNPEEWLAFDDSYITLRFALNVLKYNRFTYDGSTTLQGATSPLHIAFVALFSLFLRPETASLVVGILFFVLSSLLVYLWTRAIYEDKRVALFAGVLTSTSGWLIFDALNGLETTTFICLSLLTLYLFYTFGQRSFYIFPLFLSILTRPEGWFLASALWLWQIIKYIKERDRRILRNLFTSLFVLVLFNIPIFLLYYCYTGFLLPSTGLAKARFFADFQAPCKIWLFKHGVELFYKNLLYPLPLLIFPLMFFARKILSLPYLWFYLLIFYLFYFILFPGAPFHYWCRYQHIFLPLVIIAITGGVFELLLRFRSVSIKIFIGVLILASLVYNHGVSVGRVKKVYSETINCVKESLLDLALWLRRNTPEDSLIALHDIGVVGYFSERNILDLVGLINPEVRTCYGGVWFQRSCVMSERRVIDYLKARRPDYLVMFPEWDCYFNFFTEENKRYFEECYVSGPLYPSGLRYRVFKCHWICEGPTL